MPRTIGIDLAADGKKTSVCEIDWKGGGRAAVTFPQPARYDWTDDELVALIEAVSLRPGTKIGIDCPFGRPAAFLRLVASEAGDAPFAVPQSTIEVTSNGCPAKLAATR